MKCKPLGDKVLIRVHESPASKGGILLPESAQEKKRRGSVIAVGPGKMDVYGKLQPIEVAVGDEVLFSSYAGTEYQEGYLLMSAEDVLAVVV